MEKKNLKTNARLEENLRLQNSYRELIKKILLASELVDEEVLATVGDRFELLCEITPINAWEETDQGMKECSLDDLGNFKIVIFVAYLVDIGTEFYSPVRCLVESDGALVDGCNADWERDSQEYPQWGTLNVSLSGQRKLSFRFFTGSDSQSDVVEVGDYRETYGASPLRERSMKERFKYLQDLSSKLGLA